MRQKQDKLLTSKMLRPDFFQHLSGPDLYKTRSNLILDDNQDIYGFSIPPSDQCDFSSSFTHDDSTDISFQSYFATMSPQDNILEFPTFSGGGSSDDNLSFQQKGIWSVSIEGLKLPEIYHKESDSQLILEHLLRAYAEAMENGQHDLMEMIIKRINERINPVGVAMERVASSLFKSNENEGGYLQQESSKNFEAAFKVFYQWYPYGRFAHFAANSAIFEAIPEDTETVHIVDFDMGDGVQWPPLIDAMLQKGKALRLISIKSEANCYSADWNFDETKHRLYDYARSGSLKLKVEQMTMEDFTAEVWRTKKKSRGKKWLAFNCMVGLPHMCKQQDRPQAVEFIRWAKDLLAIATLSTSSTNAGIITYGDGKTEDYLVPDTGYASFFNNQLIHYHALLDSMECSNFPVYLTEARIAMESLFIAPDICPISWFKRWKEGPQAPAVIGLDGQSISKECLIEAKEMVKEKESLYKVKIQGDSKNQLVLEWKGIPLVTVSSWM